MLTRIPFTDREHLQDAIRRSTEILDRGGVILVPTETFYGLATRPDNQAGIDRITEMKGRSTKMSLPVLVSDWQQLSSLVKIPEKYRGKLSRKWPGALTVVLPLITELTAAKDMTLAIRIPELDTLRALIYRIGPLTGTSANQHKQSPATTVEMSLASLLKAPDLVLDGGDTTGGLASTLVDLSGDPPQILRQGAVAWDDAIP